MCFPKETKTIVQFVELKFATELASVDFSDTNPAIIVN